MDRAIGKTWPGVLTSVLSCLLVYLWGVLGFSFLWVVIAWAGYIEHTTRRATRAREREQALALVAEGEEAFLKVSTVDSGHSGLEQEYQMLNTFSLASSCRPGSSSPRRSERRGSTASWRRSGRAWAPLP